MRDFRRDVAVLSTLHELRSEAERSVAFRQGMASLAQAALDPAAVPFEGVDGEPLAESVRAMFSRALLDDLSFLRPPAAASALYALASALPSSSAERRELGRRVLLQLSHGDAQSFVALATALALGSARALEGPATRARIELMMLLPASAGVCVDPLAFALLSRRELCQRFLLEPASGHLPARRTAARLLERAARHAALRARQGDDGELSRFEVPQIQEAFSLLLADREPWVFRHAAAARGMLAGFVTRHAEDLERDLLASHALSRVRRGAMSLAARLAVMPGESLARAREILRGPIFARDPGVAAALILGLPRALEVEPEAGELLLQDALRAGGAPAAEAFLELRRELRREHDGAHLSALALEPLQLAADESGDPDQHEQLAQLCEQLVRSPELEREHGPSLPELVDRALLTSAREGPAAALAPARAALRVAVEQVERLANLHEDQGRSARGELLRLLAELDRGLLDSSALFSLLTSSERAAGDSAAERVRLSELLGKLLELLLERERAPHPTGSAVPHLSLRMRRLRLLLHLMDGDHQAGDDALQGTRELQLRAVRVLRQRAARDASSAMDRIVHASLARGIDALVRDEVFELSDALLCAASSVTRPEGMLALAEGCLTRELSRALHAAFALAELLERDEVEPRPVLHALSELAHAIPGDMAPRTEALRRALLALARSLEALTSARSVRELLRSRRALSLFEGALGELAYLTRGALKRLGGELSGPVIEESPLASLSRALESAAAQQEPAELGPALEWLDRELTRTLPGPWARAVMRVLAPLRSWPLEGEAEASPQPFSPASAETCPLPAWMPPSRRLAGFCVLRPLGSGIASSVFLVKRTEQRNDSQARGLALKVPRFEAASSRVLSEQAFEAMFAQEAPHLLRLSPHENLASFVAVESAHAPKPFLVMEWVEGPTLARVRKRKLAPVGLLDGILSGLEALHARGIGHLDLRPSRIVLRLRDGALQPVLVDFGLAGRQVRPGCGVAAYRAPELWGEASEELSPAEADIYALGCLAYELVTGRPLFAGGSEAQIAEAHRAHDGVPAALLELANDARLSRLADWMTLCLRANPRSRSSATQLRVALKSVTVAATSSGV